MAERSGYEGAEPVRSISVSDKILTSTRLDPAQKATLRAALASGSMTGLDAGSRSDLYAALHAGNFNDSCGLLGGCPALETGVAVALDDAEAELESSPRGSRAIVDLPDSSVETERRHANRLLSTDVPDRERLEPAPAVLPPSSLASLQVVSESVEAGDVVVLDRLNQDTVRLCAAAADPRVVGIVAHIDESVPSGGEAPVAIAGTIPCKVDAEYGSIAPGDLLVSSPTPGHAMRSWKPTPGTVIGKAMESLESGTGTITVLLGLR